MPAVDYDGLVDAMFHLIRQNAAGSAAVLIRMLEVLTSVAGCERDPTRLAVLQRHADLILGDAERDVATPADLADLSAATAASSCRPAARRLPGVTTTARRTRRT